MAGDEGFEPPQTESESGDNCFCSVNLVKMCHFCLKHYVCGDLHRSLFLLDFGIHGQMTDNLIPRFRIFVYNRKSNAEIVGRFNHWLQSKNVAKAIYSEFTQDTIPMANKLKKPKPGRLHQPGQKNEQKRKRYTKQLFLKSRFAQAQL